MRRLWRFADERGFDWFSVSDHFQETPPQGGDGDCFESIATLSAAAVETAVANASRILPIITTAHAPSAGNNTYWPEVYTNHSMIDA